MATTLKITAKNQVTLQIRVKPARDFAGCVENVTGVQLSVEEINEAIGDSAAEAGRAGLEKSMSSLGVDTDVLV